MILIESIPDSVMEYASWDASSGSYPSSPGVGSMYSVIDHGTVSGVFYQIGDFVVYNGTTWDHIITAATISGVTSHISLSDLDGGDGISQYYHLTQDQYAALSNTTYVARIITVSGNILGTDDCIFMDCSEGTITATLSSAAENHGKLFVLKKIDGTANAAVIAAPDHIDSEDSISLTISGEAVSLVGYSGVVSTYYII